MSNSNILNLLRLPARLNCEQTAELLGLKPHDVTTLVSAGLLKPLSKPKPSAPKYFASAGILELSGDLSWLEKVQRAIQHHWLLKNRRKSSEVGDDSFSEVHPQGR